MRIKGLQKLTLLDFPGKIGATVFLGGCNFRCPFCHNASLVIPEREGDAYTYLCESAPNTDMRKSVFYACAQKSYAIIGLEPIGMGLEDVFISLVDKKAESAGKQRR